MADKLILDDEAGIKAAIANVRSDSHATNFVIFGYQEGSKNVLSLVNEGSDGVDGLVASLDDARAMYGLVRMNQKVDDSMTVKFVYVSFLGQKMPVMSKAGVGVLKGQVTDLLSPHHLEVAVDSKEEITEEILNDRIAETSGVKSHIVGRNHAEETPLFIAQQPVGKASGSAKKAAFKPISAGRQLKYTDEEGMQMAMSDVRNDATDTNWVLFRFAQGSKDTIELVGSGSGGIKEFVDAIVEDGVNYGLIRVSHTIDESVTAKFVSVHYISDSPNVPRMLRGKLGTIKGEISTLLGQAHVHFDATVKNDLAESKILDKVAFASGSKSWVKH